jgi:hypothetical protein
LTFSIGPLTPYFHLSTPEQIDEKSQDKADNNTGYDGKVKLEIIPFDYNISWEFSEKWDLRHHREE